MPISPSQVNGSTFANTLSVTQQAQGIFNDHTASLNTILSQVDAARDTLLSSAMKGDDATAWYNSIGMWEDPFRKIIGDCQWMADMLGKTVHDLEVNQNNNVALAQALQQEVASEPQLP